ncbi:hypothetical protein PanWU01x14_078310 [Parasponia andersonii]|uniref:Uncharacterized protein n=1 Tax=Parasponia andersonii TaxID=3476 RepID=A0A2P5DBY4_PARAD|nr:hypothetical protein PanWU01x14_078310 [Parasponia andersonii]
METFRAKQVLLEPVIGGSYIWMILKVKGADEEEKALVPCGWLGVNGEREARNKRVGIITPQAIPRVTTLRANNIIRLRNHAGILFSALAKKTKKGSWTVPNSNKTTPSRP